MGQVYEDREGILWVGSEGGLLKFDRQTGTFTVYEHDPEDPQSLSHNDVRAILRGSLRKVLGGYEWRWPQ